MKTVRVTPVQGGWMVNCDLAAPTMFSSGATAERKARELGRLMARVDQTEILIHDRQGLIVGSTVMGSGRS
ncbi:hypothetical protein [Phenylobacterium sp.]|jgi:hypothetical protein|uniref:hypothetical protein n=1 Tax=Phenylobacterium sp. TaxID=1871053 RepID=UPI002F92784B